jgi:hypothetical protein
MDKQKQIEEKRKHFVEVNEMAKEIDKCYPNAKITNGYLAKNLYNAGYRKIPEGAVVLTREELQAHDKDLAEKFAEMLKEYINDRCCEELGDMACDTDYYTIDIPKTFDKIDEICKEITEGKL